MIRVRSARWNSCTLLIALASLAVPALAQETPIPKHLELARLLLVSVPPDKTSYRHQGWVKWKGDLFASEYEVHTDCSGLVSSVLDRADAQTYRRVLTASKRHPLAKDYYDSIVRDGVFARIDNLADVLPGDVVAIRYPPSVPSGTGHVMLVDAKPVQRREDTAPVIEGTRQWELAVIDSSNGPHGTLDSRRVEDGGKRSGLGRGMFRLYADLKGTLMGYSWSVEKSSKYYDASQRPIVIGRVKNTNI